VSREPREEFDAVKTAREIRDRLSEQIESMTAAEQREWLRAEVSSDTRLERLMERAAQEPAAGGASRRG